MRPLCLSLPLLVLTALASAERPPRYVAELATGERVAGDRLSNWHDTAGVPHLAGRSLLAPTAPLRWLRNRGQPLAELPPAYVEFVNGDRLPGTVIDYHTGGEDRYRPLPPHFVVRVALQFEPPENRPVPEVRILSQYVRRIVWQAGPPPARPAGTLLYRDGRLLEFRALRLLPRQVQVLLADGSRRIDWSELASVHWPAGDWWSAWYDQLAALCPSDETRLIEVETSTGLVATASLARLAARFEGNSADPDRWVHGLQPAWSLDILWIPFREIACYRSYAPHEVPLCRVPLARTRLGGGALSSRPVQINRNVQGGPLAGGAGEFGWGLGTSGGTAVAFELPAEAVALQTKVGIDQAAGGGGCIRPRVLLGGASEEPLWEGPVLEGSQRVIATGRLALRNGAARTIVLDVDPVVRDKPAGADPLDIRDFADWGDPLVELDPAALRQALDERLATAFPAWNGWELVREGGAAAGLRRGQAYNGEIPGTFESLVRAETRPLVLRRMIARSAEERWLWIAAGARPKNLRQGARIEVQVGGARPVALVVPERSEQPENDRLLAVQLPAERGELRGRLPLEIRQLPDPRGPVVDYRAIQVSSHLPTLYRVLEDTATVQPVAGSEPAEAAMTEAAAYSQARSLAIRGAGPLRIELPEVVRVRSSPQWGEVRFLRFAVRKPEGGRVAIELVDAQERPRPARYDVGQGEPAYGAATRVGELRSDWVVVTRDLFADFGNLDLRAIVVGSPDGGEALIDHVYLARGRDDFEYLRKP